MIKTVKLISIGIASFFAVTITNGQEWSMKKAKLMTPFSKDIDTANVLGEYPRPQMVREKWKNLNGIWQFQPDTAAIMPKGKLASKILVPFPVESAISGVMQHFDKLLYRRTFTVPKEWNGQRIILHFGAVDYTCEVFLNNQSIGSHKGGYDPFSFDITSKLAQSRLQEITVKVFDPTNIGGQPRGKQDLYPGGITYTCSSGIWQTVWLEPIPQTAISNIKIVNSDLTNLRLNVTTEGNATNQKVKILVNNGTKLVTSYTGEVNSLLTIPIPNPKTWSPNSPFLYDLKIVLTSNNKAIDSLNSYFGLRTITIKNIGGFQKLLLNDSALFQIGPLDQGFWPDGLYTAPTDAALKPNLSAQ